MRADAIERFTPGRTAVKICTTIALVGVSIFHTTDISHVWGMWGGYGGILFTALVLLQVMYALFFLFEPWTYDTLGRLHPERDRRTRLVYLAGMALILTIGAICVVWGISDPLTLLFEAAAFVFLWWLLRSHTPTSFTDNTVAA